MIPQRLSEIHARITQSIGKQLNYVIYHFMEESRAVSSSAVIKLINDLGNLLMSDRRGDYIYRCRSKFGRSESNSGDSDLTLGGFRIRWNMTKFSQMSLAVLGS